MHKHDISKVKIVYIILILLCAFLSIYISYIYTSNRANQKDDSLEINNIDYTTATDEQKKDGTNTRINPSVNDNPLSPTEIPGSAKKNIQVTITSSNVINNILQIRVLIGAVVNSGLCTIKITSKDNLSIIKTAEVQPSANTSTCKGFDIPLSEISSGLWNINALYDSETLTGSTNGNINI